MEAQMSVILQQMLAFLVLLIVGFIANRVGVLKGQALDSLSKLICRIIIPLMVATMIPGGTTRGAFLSALPFLLASFLLIFFFYALSLFISKVGNFPAKERGLYQALSTFGNMGFMGIPLLTAVFGSQAMLYIALYSVADQLLLWTLGSLLTSNQRTTLGQKVKMILNPCVIGIVLGIVIMLLGFKPDNVVWNTLEGLGGTTSYLALVYVGAVLAEISLKDVAKAKTAWLTVLTKMLAAPIVLFALLTAWGIFSYQGRLILAMIAGLPSMVSVVMMARINGNGEKYCACGVFITTLCSIVTIPFVVFICNLIAG